MSAPSPCSSPDLELPDDYRMAVGTLAVNAGILDRSVDYAIWSFLRVPPTVGRLITGPIVSASRKIELMRSIGKIAAEADSKVSKRWTTVGGKVSGANKLRSRIVHATWTRKDDGGQLHIARFEEGVGDPIVEPMPIEKLQGYTNEVAVAQRLLIGFLSRHPVEPDPKTAGIHRWPSRYRGREKK